jgi:hypothetical protein
MGGARGKSFKDCTPPLSFSLQPPSTPNQRQATAQMHPRTPPASACSTLASIPLPRSPRPPRAHSCRPGCRGQASPCHHATSSPQPPSTLPNSLLPPTPSVGHPAARARTAPRTHRGRRERATRSRPCTHPLLAYSTRTCKASKPRRRATLALHTRAPT